MLSDREMELLTAYVDGELSDRQLRHAERLLRASEEARALLDDLQADSRHLIELPRVNAPAGLHRSVMSAVGKVKRRPAARPRPAARTFPAWTGWAAAAAVLLVIGVGTFVSYSRTGGGGPVVKKEKPEDEKDRGPVRDGELVKNDSETDKVKDKDRRPARGPEDEPTVHDWRPDRDSGKPGPIDRPEPVLPPLVFGDGSREGNVRLERVELALPVVHKLHALDKADASRKLLEQLAAGTSFRIELLARNASSLPKEAPRAFDRISAALAARKIPVVIDSAAQANLKRPQFRHDYALFVENLTAAELRDLLAAVGAADRAAAARKAGDQRFDGSLVVKEMSAWDRRELADLMGVDPVTVRPAPPKSHAAIDLRKPISEGTSKLVDDVLDGKRPGRIDAQAGRSVLVLPLGTSRRNSAEVKRFLEARQPATAGTVQALVILRTLP